MSRPSNLIVLTVAFCVAVAGTVVFGIRAGRHARHLRWENEPIRPWMTVPFIAHTHHVPAAVLYRSIGVEPYPHDRRPLRLLARERGRPVDEMVRDLEHALAGAGHVHRSPDGPPGPGTGQVP